MKAEDKQTITLGSNDMLAFFNALIHVIHCEHVKHQDRERFEKLRQEIKRQLVSSRTSSK